LKIGGDHDKWLGESPRQLGWVPRKCLRVWTASTGSLRKLFSMSSLRVFLVENHEDTVRYMRLYLEQLDYKVCIAADMATALREIPNSNCDVLISDIGLPDGDGWQLMENLGENRPRFAIAMSGYGTGNDQRRSREVGYDYHLVKPFTPEALQALLREAGGMKESKS
jgi:DNA-binding response OmpR family regulator